MANYQVIWSKKGELPKHRNFTSMAKAARFTLKKGKNARLYSNGSQISRFAVKHFAATLKVHRKRKSKAFSFF